MVVPPLPSCSFHSLFLGTMLKSQHPPRVAGCVGVTVLICMAEGPRPFGGTWSTHLPSHRMVQMGCGEPPAPPHTHTREPLGSPLGRQRQRGIGAIGLDSCEIQAPKPSRALSQWGQAEHSSTCAFGTETLKRATEKEALNLNRGMPQLQSVLLSFSPGCASLCFPF